MVRTSAALLLAALTLGACQLTPPDAAPRAGAFAAQGQKAVPVTVVGPEAVPAAVVKATLGAAQAAADEASKRRDIDYFRLHPEAVGMRIGAGEQAGWVVSYLGTSKDRADLNVELRALLGTDQLGFHFNYSGPVTLGRALAAGEAPVMAASRGAGTRFELLYGLPGNGVTDRYGEFLGHLGQRLEQRYNARPFTFDDGPLVFAVHQGDDTVGFLFTNQANRLVLGDRKYADVQSVVMVSAEAQVLGAYTLVGFNPKTGGAGKAPAYRLETDTRFGTLAQFGEY